MKELPVENEVFLSVEQSMSEWLRALGYYEGTCRDIPIRLHEFFYYLEWVGITELCQVSKEQLQGFLQYLSTRPNQRYGQGRRRGQGLSESHLAKYVQALRQLETYLVSHELAGFSMPFRRVDSERFIPVVLTVSEVELLYKACGTDAVGLRDKAMLGLYYGCGLRRSEGVGLNASDIDFAKGFLFVRCGKQYYQRYVPVSERVLTDLETYLFYGRVALETHRTLGDHQKALLLSEYGIRIQGQTLAKRLEVLQARSGENVLQNKALSLHSLRHSIATHLYQSGLGLSQVALFLGHRDLESTQIYTHLDKNYL